MKVPLVYPKMTDSKNCPLKKCWAYEKLDGTNIHWCWNQKDKFYAFGTRRDRFPLTTDGERDFNVAHPGLEEVVSTFLGGPIIEKLDDVLMREYGRYFLNLNKSDPISEIILFTEFRGPRSFAGQHQREDKKTHYLIDVQVDGKMLPPGKLRWDFYGISDWMPKLVYNGKFTGDFVEKVRKGHYNVDEGVVIKGVVDSEVYMCKVKTDAYMERLKVQFKSNWKNYWE
jgi:hypothetical protein